MLRDLSTLLIPGPYQVEVAYRINDRGQILCSGMGQGDLHALLLNPVGKNHN